MTKPKPRPALEDLVPRCGNCHFFEAFEEDPADGTCHALPPTVVADGEGGLTVVDGQTQAGRRPCIHFKHAN